ncbi:hypothetical protein A2U01_0075202, partial [Trifolium medium]|nr:hypothetical protein [Trifolium medium]
VRVFLLFILCLLLKDPSTIAFRVALLAVIFFFLVLPPLHPLPPSAYTAQG